MNKSNYILYIPFSIVILLPIIFFLSPRDILQGKSLKIQIDAQIIETKKQYYFKSLPAKITVLIQYTSLPSQVYFVPFKKKKKLWQWCLYLPNSMCLLIKEWYVHEICQGIELDKLCLSSQLNYILWFWKIICTFWYFIFL